MRLDKFLANAGVGSRSEVKKLIKKKYVFVNNELVTKPEQDVSEVDKVVVNNEEIIFQENVYIMYHKPAGYICANKDKYQKTIMDMIDHPYKDNFQICGRLDMDVTGLVILTTDGQFNHLLTTPKKGFYKEYIVQFDGNCNHIESNYPDGIVLENDNNYQTLPFFVDVKSDNKLHIRVTEGRYHLVKNIISQLGLKLNHLHRIKVGPYFLPEDLRENEIREIENIL